MIINVKQQCRIKGCTRTFDETLQRALHEVNSWHCVGCGVSNNSELTQENFNTLCNICTYDLRGGPTKEPPGLTIIIDFINKRYRRVRKRNE